MTTKYIEIDSTYRDRNQFPLPAEFDVIISQSGLKGKSEAVDPVCDSAPILSFNTSFLNNFKTTRVDSIEVVFLNPPPGPFVVDSGIPTDTTTLLIRSIYELRRELDFYVGCSMAIDNGTDIVYRRIIAYEFMGSQLTPPTYATRYWYGLFTVNFAYPTVFSVGGFIVNPTPLPTNYPVTTGGQTLFWIPSGSFINNYYINYYVYNRTTVDFKQITAYDGETRLASLDSATTSDWLGEYNFSIRQELPSVVGRTTALVGDTEITSITSDIVLYSTLSDKVDFYIGDYIRFDFGVFGIRPDEESYSPYGEMRKITGYNPVTKTITFGPPVFVSLASLSASPGPAYINSLKYEILPFSRDNFSPFNYTGSMVSSQQQDCYEVELRNLLIPNTILQSDRGGRVAFYPYFYVAFYPISDSSTNPKGIVWSNNPNAYKVLFRAIVTDTQQPFITAFAKISGDGQVRTMKFKPNDSFHFAVYNSEGQLLKTAQQDNYAPTAPNPLVQFSALFSIRKVE